MQREHLLDRRAKLSRIVTCPNGLVIFGWLKNFTSSNRNAIKVRGVTCLSLDLSASSFWGEATGRYIRSPRNHPGGTSSFCEAGINTYCKSQIRIYLVPLNRHSRNLEHGKKHGTLFGDLLLTNAGQSSFLISTHAFFDANCLWFGFKDSFKRDHMIHCGRWIFYLFWQNDGIWQWMKKLTADQILMDWLVCILVAMY